MFRSYFGMIEPGSYPFAWVSIILGAGLIGVAIIVGYFNGVFGEVTAIFGCGMITLLVGVNELRIANRKSKQGDES